MHTERFSEQILINTGAVKVADKIKGAGGCVYLCSRVNRRRRELKRLDRDRSLTAAGLDGR